MTKYGECLQWDAFSHFQAFTILALIFLALRLHSVNTVADFLYLLSSQWLPKGSKFENEDSKLKNKLELSEIDRIRDDIDALIGNSNPCFTSIVDASVYSTVEIWSARTILFLSVSFVTIYVISWGWMSFVIKNRKNMKDVSLKTILVLAVFAAVDIVASGGFVLVRLVMYFMKDNDARIPSSATDLSQISAIAAIHLSTLQSSAASTDIVVSVVIGSLTALRIYSVIGAVSFYNKIRKRKEDKNHVSTTNDDSQSNINEFIGRSPKTHKKHSTADHRRFSLTVTSSLTDDEVVGNELKVQAVEMPLHMQKFAMKSASQACNIFTTEKHIAESIKQDFDSAFKPTWHCIVGRNWGSCVTHSKHCYIRLLYKDLTILLYKSSP